MPRRSKKGPYKMKGSPHKLGTIEGTSAYKAVSESIVTPYNPHASDVLAGASQYEKSNVPHAIDFGLRFSKIDFEDREKKKEDEDLDLEYKPKKMPRLGLKKLPISTKGPDLKKRKAPEYKLKKKKFSAGTSLADIKAMNKQARGEGFNVTKKNKKVAKINIFQKLFGGAK